MLIETNDLKELDVKKHSVIGLARKNTDLLKENELVFMVEGVRNFINLVQEKYPTAERAKTSSSQSREFHAFPSWKKTIDTYLNNAGSLVDYEPTELEPKDHMEQGRDVEYDVTGDFIDMGRHMEGVPESFGALHNGNPRSRRVRIYLDATHVWYTEHKDISAQSQRVVRLIDALEQARIRCELVVVQSGGCAHSECIVKTFNNALVLEDIAVATHPEWLRRICFRIMEHSSTYESGYGRSDWLTNKGNSFKSKFNDELTVFVHSGPDGNRQMAFDKLEEVIVEELSLTVPSLALIEVSNSGVRSSS